MMAVRGYRVRDVAVIASYDEATDSSATSNAEPDRVARKRSGSNSAIRRAG